VLVLPEDLELVGLIARPRPPLRGAVVFQDLYPERLADTDIQALLSEPPKVLVIRPSDRSVSRRMLQPWAQTLGSERVTAAVRERLLPRYRLDRSVTTRFIDRATPLEIWVRND
jgi:hypothetical protein